MGNWREVNIGGSTHPGRRTRDFRGRRTYPGVDII